MYSTIVACFEVELEEGHASQDCIPGIATLFRIQYLCASLRDLLSSRVGKNLSENATVSLLMAVTL